VLKPVAAPPGAVPNGILRPVELPPAQLQVLQNCHGGASPLILGKGSSKPAYWRPEQRKRDVEGVSLMGDLWPKCVPFMFYRGGGAQGQWASAVS
jgi:hypothetical protein